MSTPIRILGDIIGLDNLETITAIEEFQMENGSKLEMYEVFGEIERGDIPLFFQFDSRWGDKPYAGDTIKVSGCGPTSLSMVVSGLTGKVIYPDAMATFSTANGYAINGVGTSWGLMSVGASSFGLISEQVSTTASSIVNNLAQGKVMITSMNPGTFTTGGHFIVLTGLTEDGKIKVNDSYSEKLSNMVFSPELIANECKGAWAYYYETDDTNEGETYE